MIRIDVWNSLSIWSLNLPFILPCYSFYKWSPAFFDLTILFFPCLIFLNSCDVTSVDVGSCKGHRFVCVGKSNVLVIIYIKHSENDSPLNFFTGKDNFIKHDTIAFESHSIVYSLTHKNFYNMVGISLCKELF